MLKGEKVLTADYYGAVLNEAEVEQVVIIQAIRRRCTRHNDSISMVFGRPRVESWWVVTSEVVAIPWSSVGTLVFCKLLPRHLYARHLCRW